MQSVAKRFGEESGGSESEAEGSGDAGRERGKGKGKEMAVTVTDEPTEELVSASVVSSRINGDLGNGKRKGKVSKKVRLRLMLHFYAGLTICLGKLEPDPPSHPAPIRLLRLVRL